MSEGRLEWSASADLGLDPLAFQTDSLGTEEADGSLHRVQWELAEGSCFLLASSALFERKT